MAGAGHIHTSNITVATTWADVSNELQQMENNPNAQDKHVRGDNAGEIYLHGDKTHRILSAKSKYRQGMGNIGQVLDREFGQGFSNFVTKGFKGGPHSGYKTLQVKDSPQFRQMVDNYGPRFLAVQNDPLVQQLGPDRFVSYLMQVDGNIEKHNNAPQMVQNAGITDIEKVALYAYTSTDDFKEINDNLRNDGNDPLAQLYIKELDSALQKLPMPQPLANEHSITVHRGAGYLPHDVDVQYQNGKSVTELAYASTSTSKSTSFGGTYQFEIVAKANTAGRDISAFSKHNEGEILFPHGTDFSVISRKGESNDFGLGIDEVNIVMREN